WDGLRTSDIHAENDVAAAGSGLANEHSQHVVALYQTGGLAVARRRRIDSGSSRDWFTAGIGRWRGRRRGPHDLITGITVNIKAINLSTVQEDDHAVVDVI